MIENIRLSFQGIWSHKLRSLLTMLGIIIGIAAIIAIVSTIKGTNERIKNNIIGSGENLVKVQLSQDDWQYTFDDYSGIPEGVPIMTDKMVDDLRDLPNVLAASAFNFRQESSIFYGNSSASSMAVYGITEDYLKTCNYNLEKGRLFIDSDFKEFKNVCIIDEKARDGLFSGGTAIGKTIEIKKIPFIVVGIAEKSSDFVPEINSIEDYYTYSSSNPGMIFIPDSVWPNLYYFDEPKNVVIKAAATEDMSSVGKAAEDYLNQYISNKEQQNSYSTIKYKSEDLLKEAQNLQDLAKESNTQLIWIASISLLVGGIGVMNIMLVSVTERTKEIGLKKAIGAKKGKIRAQFLTEAVALTSLGGIIGVASGIGLSQFISNLTGAAVAVSYPAIAIAVAFSMVIGIVFGLFPAIQASNLNPIEALRRE